MERGRCGLTKWVCTVACVGAVLPGRGAGQRILTFDGDKYDSCPAAWIGKWGAQYRGVVSPVLESHCCDGVEDLCPEEGSGHATSTVLCVASQCSYEEKVFHAQRSGCKAALMRTIFPVRVGLARGRVPRDTAHVCRFPAGPWAAPISGPPAGTELFPK